MKRIFRILLFIPRAILALITFLLLVIGILYAIPPVYDFPEAGKFSGENILNPYRKLRGNWYKANFHAHSRAYGGLTDGRKNSPDEIFRFYDSHGYDVISLSNYHSVYRHKSGDTRFFPAYEHGYNIFKTHQIVLNPVSVTWYDIPLPQSVHHKQFILNLIRDEAPATILAHPKFVRGYSFEDLGKLTNYDAIEVLNHYRISDAHWDAMLSAGRFAPIIGDDDNHDISNEGETGVCWTYINAPSDSIGDIVNAIREGRTFGVTGKRAEMDNFPREVAVNESLLSVEVDSLASEIRFIGQGGKLRKTVRNTFLAQYEFLPGDTYIRAEIISPKTHIYLNPVFRTKSGVYEKGSATVNWPLSLAYWLCFVILYAALGYFLRRRIRSRRLATVSK